MDRIDDLEQSLITLAKFVKEETNKLKSENENIRTALSSSASKTSISKVIGLEAKINDAQKKIALLMLKGNDQKKGNDAYASTHAADYTSKFSNFESKIEELQSKFDSVKSSENPLKERLSNIEQKLESESKRENDASGVKALYDTLESQISSLASEVEKLKQSAMSKQDTDTNTKYYMGKLSEQISTLENDLQSKIENARSALDDEFQNRLDGLKMVLEEEAKKIAQKKNKEENFGKEISEIREESFAEEAYLDKRIQDATAKIENALNSTEVDKKIDRKLDEMNEQVTLKMHALEMLENKMNKALEEKVKKVEGEEKTNKKQYDKETKAKFQELEKEFTSKLENIKGAEKKLDELVQRKINLVEKEQKREETELDKNLNTRMEELEDKLSLKLHALESLENKMNEILGKKMNMLEEDEGIEIASADKKIQDLHKAVADMQREIAQLKSVDVLEEKSMRKDVEALKNRVKFFDDHIKTISTKHMTKQLEEFAHYLDGKIPEVVTLEEFQRHMDMLDKKINSINAPDTTQVMQKIGLMEKEINGVLTELKDIYGNMPKFVE